MNVKWCSPSGNTGSLPPLPPRTAFLSVPSGSGISAVQSPVLGSALSTIAQTVASPPAGTSRRLYFPPSILTAIFEAPWFSCGWHHPLPLTFTVPPIWALAFSTVTVGFSTDGVHVVGSRTVNCSEVIERLTSFVSDCPENRETVKYCPFVKLLGTSISTSKSPLDLMALTFLSFFGFSWATSAQTVLSPLTEGWSMALARS